MNGCWTHLFLLWLQNLVSKLNDPTFRRGAAHPGGTSYCRVPLVLRNSTPSLRERGQTRVVWVDSSEALLWNHFSNLQPSLACYSSPKEAIPDNAKKGAWRKGNLLASEFLFISLWASLVVQTVQNPPAMRETWVWSLGWEDPLEKGMVTHSSILAWRIPWIEECSRLQSMGSQRVGHGCVTFAYFRITVL